MNKAQHNFRLLQEIEENRRFLLQVYAQNPELLKTADARIKPLLAPLPIEKSAASTTQRGISLIELIMFIVIVSAALAGVLTVLNITTKSSADPMIRKQMLAIAEGLLEEVQLQPFTWCDPTDANAATATSTAGCATIVENLGVPGLEAAQTRTNATTPFNNVNDYDGATLTSTACPTQIADSTGNRCAPSGYSATIAVTPEAINGVGDAMAASASLRITVTVTHGADSITLEGYRTRHSPNLLP